MFLFVAIVSCVSGESLYVLLRFRMRFQSLEGLVLYEMVLRCLHVCCSCRILPCISLFIVCMQLMIFGVGRVCLRWSLVRILCLTFLLNPGLNCLIAPVGIYCLVFYEFVALEYFMAASMIV